MLSKLYPNVYNTLAKSSARTLGGRFVISSRDMKCSKTHDIVLFPADEWKPSGPHRKNYAATAERYPQSALWSTDLDGMDTAPTNEKALKLGQVEEFLNKPAESYMGNIRQPHPVWTRAECDEVQITHLRPKGVAPRLAWSIVWTLRRLFDLGTGYTLGFKNDACMMRRICILETVAGIPGMVGGAIRHFRSLRRCQRDYGWIHSLLEEAENERMHLMIVMSIYKPHPIVRAIVMAGQAFLLPFYTLGYALSPKFAHSFVGYLEEEAVKTYTQMLELMDKDKLPEWECLAPEAARKYYHLPEGATMRDIITNIRADEAHHRQLNHCLAWMGPKEVNPFPPGY